MANTKLMSSVSMQDLLRLGFVESGGGEADNGWGREFVLENDSFMIVIDSGWDVGIRNKRNDFDLEVKIESLEELELLTFFISE